MLSWLNILDHMMKLAPRFIRIIIDSWIIETKIKKSKGAVYLVARRYYTTRNIVGAGINKTKIIKE